MADTTDFFAHFSVLPDPRMERTKKHKLLEILFIALCTMLCGGETFTDMQAFGEAKEEWLRTRLEWPPGIVHASRRADRPSGRPRGGGARKRPTSGRGGYFLPLSCGAMMVTCAVLVLPEKSVATMVMV